MFLLALIALPAVLVSAPVVLLLLWYFRGSMAQVFGNISSYIFSRIGESYNYLTDGEVCYGKHYSVVRHSRPFIVYQGIKTAVPITIMGDKPLPADRRVFLQRRGYRTGLLGWTIGGMLGGSKLPGFEVTPTEHSAYTALPPSQLKTFSHTLARIFHDATQVPQQTVSVHIPVASGDGYFRLRVTRRDPYNAIAESPVFRVGSIAFSSAHPQGASLVGLLPEFAVRTVFVAAKTTTYAAFYAAFPFLKLAEYTPGPWRAYAIRTLYQHFQLEEKYNVTENIQKAKDRQQKIYNKVPFGAVGVRSLGDLKRDEEAGRGGVWYDGPGMPATSE